MADKKMKYKPMHRRMKSAFSQWGNEIQSIGEKGYREYNALRKIRQQEFDEQMEALRQKIMEEKNGSLVAAVNGKWCGRIDRMDYSTGKMKKSKKRGKP